MKRILPLALLAILFMNTPASASGKGLFRKKTAARSTVERGKPEVRYALIPVNSRWPQLTRITVTRDAGGRIASVKRR